MPFPSVSHMVNAEENGATWTGWFHKTGGPASFGTGRWADLSMGAGIPKYNAYIGSQAVATPIYGTGNEGIYLGPTPASGQTKHLTRILLQSTSTTLIPAEFVACDYLMAYPLIDGDDTAQQDMDNTLTLPRYATGDGVQCMIVCTTPMVQNSNITITYTNSDGTSGRTSTSSLLFSLTVGCIVSTSSTGGAAGSASPFIPLASGDKGIRSIESVTVATGSGGFFALVLVKPLANISLFENVTAHEILMPQQRGWNVPRVYDGAYLNFIYNAAQNGTAVLLRGAVTTVWG